MVHIAGSLPKGEANGLEAHSRHLAEALVKGQKHFVIGVVKTKSVKTGDDLVPDPTVMFTRVEMIDLDSDLEDLAADLLTAAADARRVGGGQQTFDMPKQEAEPEEPETLALDAGAGYYFQVRDLPAGRFGLYLCTHHVEGVKKRGNLLRSEMGEVAPGDYQLHELPSSLSQLGALLVQEWETNTGTSVLNDDDGVIDAEVVDEEAEGGDD